MTLSSKPRSFMIQPELDIRLQSLPTYVIWFVPIDFFILLHSSMVPCEEYCATLRKETSDLPRKPN